MGGVPISTLMFGTFVVVLVVGAFLWFRHMRKPENRHPMKGEPERNIGKVLDEAHAKEEGRD